MTGRHRDHARKSLRLALVLRPVTPPRARPLLYQEPVIEALRFLWAVQALRVGGCSLRCRTWCPDCADSASSIEEETAALLVKIAPATIDRRLKADRAKLGLRGRSHTKPGTLLKDSIPIRTWAEWDDAVPGFVEIDLVGHEGGNNRGDCSFTLDITDIAIGWTETRSVKNKA